MFGGLWIVLYFVNTFSQDDDHRQPESQQEDEEYSQEIVYSESLDALTQTALANTGDKSVVTRDLMRLNCWLLQFIFPPDPLQLTGLSHLLQPDTTLDISF